jgi:chromosome partitioning protein
VKHPEGDVEETSTEATEPNQTATYETAQGETVHNETVNAETAHTGIESVGTDSPASTPEAGSVPSAPSVASAPSAASPVSAASASSPASAPAEEDSAVEESAVEEPAVEESPAAPAHEQTLAEALAAAPAPTTQSSQSSFDDTPLARELAEITRRRQALNAQSLPLPSAPRIFTVANQKGGVGKTTTTVNLAAALARGGARVLVIDLDPQGNASTALGVEHRADTISVYDVIINDEPMADVVQKSPEFDGLFCVPATIHLAGAEIELVSLVAREQRLRTSLEKFLDEAEEEFHYVVIDCPPSLGLLTINAFVAAREVLIPIQCEYYALEGLSQLLSNIQLIERHLNPRLTVSTILLTMYDSRTNLANQVADDVREHFPNEVLTTLIPRSVRISEAPSYGQSVISYDPSSPGSLSYLEAAAEIAKRGAPA